MTDHYHVCTNLHSLEACGAKGFCECECGARWDDDVCEWEMPSTEEEYRSQSGDDNLANIQQQARQVK